MIEKSSVIAMSDDAGPYAHTKSYTNSSILYFLHFIFILFSAHQISIRLCLIHY